MLLEDSDAPQLRSEAKSQPGSPPASTRDEFDDDFLCPYCAAQTHPEDRKCAACTGDLWVRFRRREKRSTLLWIMIASQYFSTAMLGIGPLLGLVFAGLKITAPPSLQNLSDPQAMTAAIQGFPAPAEVLSAALAAMPGLALLLSFLPCLFSAIVLVGLFLRWRPVYYMLLADAILWLVATVALVILAQVTIPGAVGAVLALAKLLLVFQIEEDFQWERRRILLRTDGGLSSGFDFLARGDFYAKRKMWALAAIHLRVAAGKMRSQLDCYTALAVAYIRLKRYDRAARTLAQASRISPNNPRVEQLTDLLDQLRTAGSSL